MFRVSTVALSLLSVGLGAAVAWEAMTVAHLRRELTQSRSAAAEQAVEAQRGHQREIANLNLRNEAYKADASALRLKLGGAAGSERMPPVAAAAVAESSESASGKSEPASGDFAKALSKMYADPSMKKMLRQQQTMSVRMMYGDLAKQLRLDSNQAEQVMALLGDRQADLSESGMAIINGGEARAEESGRKAAEISKKYDAELQGALGDKYAGFQAFEKSMGDRMLIGQYQEQFSNSGQPLSEEQRGGLLQIMSEERERTPVRAPAGDPQSQMKAIASDEYLHEYLARQGEVDQRILARAEGILSPEQLTTLRDAQNNMAQMQQMGLKMSRVFMELKPSKP